MNVGLTTRADWSSRRNSDNSGAGRDRIENYGARADDGALANLRSRESDRANSYMRKRMDRHAATQQNTGRKVDVIADLAVMLDHGRRVQNAIPPDLRPCIDYSFRHDYGPIAKPGESRYHGRRVDQSGGQETVFETFPKACSPGFVIPNRYQVLGATLALQRSQVEAGAENLTVAVLTVRALAGIVDEGNSLKPSHRLCDIEDYLPVPAGAP